MVHLSYTMECIVPKCTGIVIPHKHAESDTLEYCCMTCGQWYGPHPRTDMRDLAWRPVKPGKVWPWMTEAEERAMLEAQRQSWGRQDKD